jgi:type IV secretory pathway VirB9-like protein
MRTFICSIIFSGFAAVGLMAQKLETQPVDPKKVIRVETARDHLTVIELGDPVMMVAVGNQNAFSIERRENKVFVKPVEDEARTLLKELRRSRRTC